MMRPMACPENHDAHEAEGPELDDSFRIAGCDAELDAVGQVLGRGGPADPREFLGVGGNHALDRLQGSALPCHTDLDAVIDCALDCCGSELHLSHSLHSA